MKKWLIFALTLLLGSALFITEVHAKRFGGGKSFGKQYNSYSSSKKSQSSSTTNTATTGAAANAGRSSGMGRWLGPLAGLAAGGLLASLFFGDAFEGLQIMDILLFAGLIFGGLMLFKAMRAKSAPRAAGAGPFGAAPPVYGQGQNAANTDEPTAMHGTDSGEAPAWFDAAGFANGAKTHFIRLQAAWDKGDFRDIREYTTPEMFAELQREFENLGASGHHTEVMMLNAQLLGTRRESDRVVASVHFTGMLREEQNAGGNELSEIWHVVHDWDQAQGDWLIAGIQQAT